MVTFLSTVTSMNTQGILDYDWLYSNVAMVIAIDSNITIDSNFMKQGSGLSLSSNKSINFITKHVHSEFFLIRCPLAGHLPQPVTPS